MLHEHVVYHSMSPTLIIPPKYSLQHEAANLGWCERGDSPPHPVRDQILSRIQSNTRKIYIVDAEGLSLGAKGRWGNDWRTFDSCSLPKLARVLSVPETFNLAFGTTRGAVVGAV